MAVRRRSRSAAADVFPGFTEVAEIGAGSLATVFRARETDTGRAVALKLLNVRDVSPRALESFQRESVALGAVSAHPNIVTLYRTFQTADGRPVLVLELCAGSIFNELGRQGGLSAQRVVAVGVKMAAALETAHRAEILHRDVKPQNILVTEFGEPALADFGVAMLQSSSQTTSGLFDFTTLHVAPELLEGRPTSPATDVYELASTLYQLIAGQSAFRAYEGESPASVILRILRDPVRPLVSETIPAALSDLLVSSMSKDQNSRPSSAAEFATELNRVERSQGWPATTFLVRDFTTRTVSGQAPIAVPSPFVAIGRPAWGGPAIAPVVGEVHGSLVTEALGRPIDRAGGRAPAPLDPPAGRVSRPPVRPIENRWTAAHRATADPGDGFSQVCANGHLVAAVVRACPICGSVNLAPAPDAVAASVAPSPIVVTVPPDVTTDVSADVIDTEPPAAQRSSAVREPLSGGATGSDSTVSHPREPSLSWDAATPRLRPGHDPWDPNGFQLPAALAAERVRDAESPPTRKASDPDSNGHSATPKPAPRDGPAHGRVH